VVEKERGQPGGEEGEEVTLDAASPEPVLEQTKPDHAAFMANSTLMAKFSPDSRLMLVMEFIAAERLYAGLNAFLKRKLR
jgi:hypothetical protein